MTAGALSTYATAAAILLETGLTYALVALPPRYG